MNAILTVIVRSHCSLEFVPRTLAISVPTRAKSHVIATLTLAMRAKAPLRALQIAVLSAETVNW